MGKILDFLNKWGIMILVIVSLLIYLSTCGTGGNIDRTNRRIDKVEKALHSIDSTASTKVSEAEMEIMLEIVIYQTSREVVYSENSVVRTVKRPDDLMNEYDHKIKELRKKLELLRK